MYTNCRKIFKLKRNVHASMYYVKIEVEHLRERLENWEETPIWSGKNSSTRMSTRCPSEREPRDCIRDPALDYSALSFPRRGRPASATIYVE